jgi:hypothetical protein
MTPERAALYSAWFAAASGLLVAVAVVVGFFVHAIAAVAAGALALLCLLESRSLDGWRGGYLARERQERAELDRSGRDEASAGGGSDV